MVDATLVTVHGFWSDPTTWDRLSAVWRADDELAGLKIHGFGYPSPRKPSLPFSGTRVPDFGDIAQMLAAEYATVLARASSVTFVTHSQGGLILQRFLAWMVSEGRACELARIQTIVTLACPNGGSQYFASIRHALGYGRHPQAADLEVLSKQVADTQRAVLARIVHASGFDDHQCRIPFYVYAGGSDGIVPAASAQAAFPGAGTLAGNHFTILDPAAPGNRTADVIKHHILDNLAERPPASAQETELPVADGGTRIAADCDVSIKIQPGPPAREQLVVGSVPQVPPAFQPREELLSQLRAAGPGISVVRALTGMRGVGKTQIAAAYARECIDAGWRLVAWVNAETLPEALSDLSVVAERLGIGTVNDSVEAVGQRVRSRLEADGERCLMVFDNVTGLNALRPYLPAAGKSQVALTSVSASVAGVGTSITVDVFTEPEALAFLTARTRREDLDGAHALSRELGYLPLALAQATAVIVEQRLTYQVYLSRLRSFPLWDYLTQRDGEPYPRGVAEAVVLSIEAAKVVDPSNLCAPLLDTIALLSPAGVSRALLYKAGEEGALSGRDGSSVVVAPMVDQALGRLAGASLLTLGSDDNFTVTMHRLVARVARERRAHDGTLAVLGERASKLVGAIEESLGEPWKKRPAARDFVQHVIALNDHLTFYLREEDSALVKDLLDLRFRAIWVLNELGDSAAQAVELGKSLAADCERLLGGQHPKTLTVRSYLATAYDDAGLLEVAVPLFERTLADRERVLGNDHPDTLTSRNNLANAYRSTGRVQVAVPLFERTLADRERVLGNDHPDTLMSRSNLAYAYQRTGHMEVAVPLFERTLADRERVLGNDHPDTLMSRSNLAYAYQRTGHMEVAVPLFERTLADRERVLGNDHPDTLMSRSNLARAYQRTGHMRDAIPLFQSALVRLEQILGSEHPYTAAVRSNLAQARREEGDSHDQCR